MPKSVQLPPKDGVEVLDLVDFALSPTQLEEFERIMSKPLSGNKGVCDLLARRAPWEHWPRQDDFAS